MGRPLYSTTPANAFGHATTTTQPTVAPASATTSPAAAAAVATATAPDVVIRAAPDSAPDHPEVSKWSYWNAFDPDADEFFDGPNAVYEAFVDPSTLPSLREEIILEEESREARRMLRRLSADGFIPSAPTSSSSSSSSSEGTSSGRESPIDILPRRTLSERSVTPGAVSDAEPVQEASATTTSILPPEVLRAISDNVPAEPDIDRPVTPPPRPSTPPSMMSSVSATTPLVYSPSPPPTVTPRLFTWAPHNAYPTSPLPNRSARTTTVHLSHFNMPPVIVNRVLG